MNHQRNMSARSRGKSFSYAINGLLLLYKYEPNAKLHAVATAAVVVLGITRHISHLQWLAICFAIAIVWITEAVNTCIENLCNFCCDNKHHPAIKIIKDISAASVLIAAIASLSIGIIIFFF